MDNKMKTTVSHRKSRVETRRDVMAILLGDEAGKAARPPNTTKTLPIDVLMPHPKHKFKLYTGKRLDDMVWSIREVGVLLPVIARPLDGDGEAYEILSGHNRVNAARIAGLAEVPAIIKTGLTGYEADLIVTVTNLYQRSFADLSHSERAIVLKHYLETIKSQGKRNDLLDEIEKLSNPQEYKEYGTSGLIGQKTGAREKASKRYGLDARTVSRYIRLCGLSETLLERVDADEIGLYPAVSLSYIPPDEQAELERLLGEAAYKVDMKKAESLRELSERGKLTQGKMVQVLSGELNRKAKSKATPPFKLKAKICQKYFGGGTPPGEIEATIDQALAEYFENHKKENTA